MTVWSVQSQIYVGHIYDNNKLRSYPSRYTLAGHSIF